MVNIAAMSVGHEGYNVQLECVNVREEGIDEAVRLSVTD